MILNDETRRKLRLMNIGEFVEAIELQQQEPKTFLIPFNDRFQRLVDSVYQQKYNEKVENYRELYEAINPDAFEELEQMLTHEHELSMKRMESWEATLEAQKDQIELEISQVTANKNNFEKLLGNNIKKDFSYGGTAK